MSKERETEHKNEMNVGWKNWNISMELVSRRDEFHFFH